MFITLCLNKLTTHCSKVWTNIEVAIADSRTMRILFVSIGLFLLFALWFFFVIPGLADNSFQPDNNTLYINPPQDLIGPTKLCLSPKELKIKHLNAIVAEMVPRLDPIMRTTIVSEALKYSEKFNLPPGMILAVIKNESNFNPLAVSNKNARGLMQIILSVHSDKLEELGISQTGGTHIANNIHLGSWILKEYYDTTKSIRKALTKYVGGKHDTYVTAVLATYADISIILRELEQQDQLNAIFGIRMCSPVGFYFTQR